MVYYDLILYVHIFCINVIVVYQLRKLVQKLLFHLTEFQYVQVLKIEIKVLVWCPQSLSASFTASISNKFRNRDIKPGLGF